MLHDTFHLRVATAPKLYPELLELADMTTRTITVLIFGTTVAGSHDQVISSAEVELLGSIFMSGGAWTQYLKTCPCFHPAPVVSPIAGSLTAATTVCIG